MIDPQTFSAFVKEAGPRVKGGALRGIKIRDLAAATAGAGTLYGANRLVQDIKTGEQVRKQQRMAAKGGY